MTGVGPQPLVPPDLDLRDFAFMPLDAARLRDSKIVDAVSGDEFRAAVLLWCAAWHQVPAGSLPDDDVQLAKLAGYGRVVKEWAKVKDGALYGFILCSDGRWYHPTVCEKAREGWASKQTHIWKKECDRVRKDNKARAENGLPALPIPPKPSSFPPENQKTPPETVRSSAGKTDSDAGIPAESALKGQGQGQGQGQGDIPPSVSNETSGGARTRAKATRLPDDWAPSLDDRAFAKTLGFSDRGVEYEAGKFRDYWHGKAGKDAAKVDWPGTWRNWMRRSLEQRGKAPQVTARSADQLYDKGL